MVYSHKLIPVGSNSNTAQGGVLRIIYIIEKWK